MTVSLTRRALLAAPLTTPLRGAPAHSEGPEATGNYGVVATDRQDAVRAGARLFAAGGNAFDALAAAALVQCMLEPDAVDIGGYVASGIILEGRTGRVFSIDSNSVSPAEASPTMYKVIPRRATNPGINENEYQCSVENDANVEGPLAVGVPGTLAGIGTLWERWGRAKWADVVAPSLELLDRGFPYLSVANSIKSKLSAIQRYPASAQHLMPGGAPPKPEDTWYRRDMEKTLRRLSTAGWQDLYQGELARRIAGHVRQLGGVLTERDMADFSPRITPPYQTSYHGAQVHGAILPNGGITLLEILNLLENFDALPASDPRYWHRIAEVLKIAWRDRLTYLADPDHASVPVARLLDKNYAAGRIENLRAFPTSVDRLPMSPAAPSPGTVSLSAADGEGNMVAMTISHGGAFGSCVAVPGTGIFLGHGMCRFDPRPGKPNSVGARKRPLNNVAPTLVRTPSRDFAIGMRGGRRIISSVSIMCQRMIDENISGLEAVSGPRLHLEGQEPLEVARNLDPTLVAALQKAGHEVKVLPRIGGNANAVERSSGGRLRGGANGFAAAVGKRDI